MSAASAPYLIPSAIVVLHGPNDAIAQIWTEFEQKILFFENSLIVHFVTVNKVVVFNGTLLRLFFSSNTHFDWQRLNNFKGKLGSDEPTAVNPENTKKKKLHRTKWDPQQLTQHSFAFYCLQFIIMPRFNFEKSKFENEWAGFKLNRHAFHVILWSFRSSRTHRFHLLKQ